MTTSPHASGRSTGPDATTDRAVTQQVGEPIRVEHLSKWYGAVAALNDVSFNVRAGEILGLLGRNGAGKTTTVEILEGFRSPSAGTVRVLGCDPAGGDRRLKNLVGTVPQTGAIDAALSVGEVARLYASFYRPRRPTRDVLAEVGLEAEGRTRVAVLSGGQRRRLDLALALVGCPRVLFLDEPTTGLDPAARHQVWGVVARLRSDGVAIVLTSHYLEEVEALADRVVILQRGRVIADGDTTSLRSRAHPLTTISFLLSTHRELPTGPWQVGVDRHGRTTLATAEPIEAIRTITSWSIQCGIDLDDLEMRKPTLEEAYLELTTNR